MTTSPQRPSTRRTPASPVVLFGAALALGLGLSACAPEPGPAPAPSASASAKPSPSATASPEPTPEPEPSATHAAVIDAVVAAWAADTPAGIVDRGVGSVAEPFQGVPVLDQDGGWWVAVPTAALPGADAALLTDAEGGPAYAGTELGSPAQLAAAAAFEAEGLTLVQGRGWTAGAGLGLSCVALPSGAACAPLAESAPLLDAARPVLASVPAPASAPDPSTGLGTPVYGQPMTEDSPVAGFARAEFASWGAGSIGGAGMLSYRVGTGEWQFFRSAQQGPSCSAYDTPELRNAFAGRSCLLPDGTSDEVQPAA